MKYWLVIGIKDKVFEKQLHKNLDRLNKSNLNVQVLVVETGEAMGLFDDAITQDKVGVVPFLQSAFDHLKKESAPGDWFVRIDVDDYYGPEYLPEIDSVRKMGADGTGIPSVYVRAESGSLYYCESKRVFRGACGGTLAGRIDKSIYFKETEQPWGEDSVWVSEMIDEGYKILPRSSKDYAFVRWSGHQHTYPVPGDALPHVWNCSGYHQGEWSEDKLTLIPDKSNPIKLDAKAAFEGIKAINNIAMSSGNHIIKHI